MNVPISLKNVGSGLPYIRYSPQNNTMTIAGEDNTPRTIPFLGKSFAVDIETGAKGWLLISEGLRDWKPFPIGGATPPFPGPGYRRGFAVLFYAPKLLRSSAAHEMCSSTNAHLSFCERLYNEAEPNFGKGNVPVVKIIEAELIEIGRGQSRELKFEIVKWIPRPAAIIEALAKLSVQPGKHNGSADATGGDDFNDETAPSREEPPGKEKTTAEKSKKARDKAPPEQPSTSDILDDSNPF